MKKIVLSLIITSFFSLPAFSKTNVITSYQYIEDIVNKIGKDKVSVNALSKGANDPHFITPKPSLIAKARSADLLIINGGELEIGWIPPIIKQSNNSNIQINSKGFLDLSSGINLIEKSSSVSRAEGDVHSQGNPHFILNPDNVLLVSKMITKKLSELDSANKDFYKKNNDEFTKKWNEKLNIWNNKMKSSKNKKVIQYHKLYDYLLQKYQIKAVNTLEPLAGIPPTTKHLAKIIQEMKDENIKIIIQDVYHNQNSTKFVADKTQSNMIILPHDVGATAEAKDIFSLFDEITDKLSK
ncbi:MAG: zinc ABC transporter substrate-binding protein [Candidatus Sericytochromatia bacterium]